MAAGGAVFLGIAMPAAMGMRTAWLTSDAKGKGRWS